jgi:putative oxidoreductase
MPLWLSGLPALADPALLVLRFVIGAMFALSGFFKVTDGERRNKMRESLADAGVPASLAPVFSLVELLGGLGVLLGFFTALSSLGLLAISLGALVTTAIPRAEGKGIHKLENVLYTPEAILAAGLLVLMATGPGGWSLDALLLG